MGDIGQVAVIGAGLMGHGIAQVFATAGLAVKLHDAAEESLQRGLQGIELNLEELVSNELLGEADAAAALRLVSAEPSLEKAVAEADFVIEAVFEDLAVKKPLFSRLGELAPPHTILASNTSGLGVGELSAASGRPERTLVSHFWNPPYPLDVVEVVPGPQTTAEVLDLTCLLLRRCGKRPVRLSQEVKGHIGNRLQFALLREALSLVQRGIVSVEDVDAVVEQTIGRRLPVTGPIRSADLGGLDVFQNIGSYLFDDLEGGSGTLALLDEKLAEGKLGAKTGQGFYEWDEEQLAEMNRQRSQELMRWLKKARQNR